MTHVPKEWRANMALRRRLLWDGAHVPGAAEAIKAECASNILFYVNLFCHTYNPRLKSGKVMPFVGYPFQDEAMLRLVAAVEDGHDVAIKKSRDMGASWINLFVVDWFFRFRPHSSILLVSRNEDYVDKKGDRKSLFWKLDFTLDSQPKWLVPRFNRTALHLENLDNGATVDGESTTGDVGRGDRRTFILMDEFAAFDALNGDKALASTGSTTDCRIFNSTPQGSSNAFARVCENKDGATEVITMHWSQHPCKNKGLYTSVRDEKTGRMVLNLLDGFKGKVKVRGIAENVAAAKMVAFPEDYPFVLDGKMRSPWYDNECKRGMSQAQIAQELDIDFAGSDYQFFDPVALDKYEQLYCRDADFEGEIQFDPLTCRPGGFEIVAGGPWRFWMDIGRGGKPVADRKFVIGADVAAGTGASNSSLAVYDAETSEKVAEYVNPKILPADFANLATSACRFFNNAFLVPDRSGPTGEVFVKKIIENGYMRIYQRRNEKKVTREIVQEYGLWLNPAARTSLLEEYRTAIGEAKVINRSARAIGECRQFIRKMDGTIEHSASAHATTPDAARTAHGDIVIGDALAYAGLRSVAETPQSEEPEIPHGSMKERMEKARLEEARERNGEEFTDGGWDCGLGDPGWGTGGGEGW